MTRTCIPAALLASTLILMSAGACKSSTSGSTVTSGGGGPVGTGSCTEDVPDPVGNPSGLTIVAHRIVASLVVSCSGNVAPATYRLQLLLFKNGNPGPGNVINTAPGPTPVTKTVSTACSQGGFMLQYFVIGTWPDPENTPIKGGKNFPAKDVKLDDC